MLQGGGFDDQQVAASDERLEQILAEATGFLFYLEAEQNVVAVIVIEDFHGFKDSGISTVPSLAFDTNGGVDANSAAGLNMARLQSSRSERGSSAWKA